ncbi:FAD:protein FMN transferase [Flavobacteriaceae bacterium]|nr:FAD:protein FMN transferase [Flavobacteriaceae bacterium]MDC1195005.1 FAD:protein FMN transferase [Flavobacteriaceae bacterium]MDG1384745.1 FAD:protein FMN transferase [Flavobacteriaceae bacterium]
MINKLLLIFCFGLVSCSNTPEQLRAAGPVFGTTYSIIYDSSQNFETAFDSLFFEVNRSMSTYIPTSDISKVNINKSVSIDHHFESVFKTSKEIYSATQGKFDPTIGAVVNAWDFGPEGKIEALDSLKINELMLSVGMDKITLNNGVILKPKASRLDFNAIAKGYGVDVIGRYLESKNIQNYLIEIGGEIRAKGINTVKNTSWKVGVQHPDLSGDIPYVNTLSLQDESMATSGTYRKFKLDAEGNRYTHIIDTKTGYPIRSGILSVSVVSPNCMVADAYATALQAMTLDKIRMFLKIHPELKVFIVFVNDANELQTEVFNGFPEN